MNAQSRIQAIKLHQYTYIIDWIKSLDSGKILLDAGAGIMRYKKYAGHLNYISQDFGSFEGEKKDSGQKDYQWDSKKCDIICDITSIPIKSESADYILFSEVIEHLPRPLEAIKELARILKHDGEILITAPFACAYHQSPYFYSSGYSTHFYEQCLSSYNLKITEIKEIGSICSLIDRTLLKTCMNHKEVGLTQSDTETLNKAAGIIAKNAEAINRQTHKQPEGIYVKARKMVLKSIKN